MAKHKSSKVFIRFQDEICDFMRLFVGTDGSVMMSFAETGKEILHAIFDENLGELRGGDFIERNSIDNPKISFHQSGLIKLTCMVGLNKNAIDRVTILGEPMSNVGATLHLIEILVPNELRVTSHTITDRDIVLDATSMKGCPIRCSVFRMNKVSFDEITRSKRQIISTSKIEFVNALEVDQVIWGFVLRVSTDDKEPHRCLFFFLPGKIKWGGENEI